MALYSKIPAKQEHSGILERLAAGLDSITMELPLRESNFIEFKENFNWANRSSYAKTMAAFANTHGGYLIFGVADKPRRLVGLSSNNFATQDEHEITEFLNGLFSPEIHYEKFATEIAARTIGVVWTWPCASPPVMPIKNAGEVKEAEIYYRYNARNDKIKYLETKALLERERSRESAAWRDLFSRVARLGPDASGLIDIGSGIIDGKGGSLLAKFDATVPRANDSGVQGVYAYLRACRTSERIM